MTNKLPNTSKIILTIDFGNCYIKAAIYQESISFAQPVTFSQEIPELIPSVIYLPKNLGDMFLFGKEAIEAGMEDPDGLIYHIPYLFAKSQELITLPNRISVGKQDIINSIFNYIHKETLELNTNNKPIDACQFIESADMNISLKRNLLMAAKIAGFEEIQTRNFYQSVVNQWIFEVKYEDYQHTNNLILLDINYNKTNIIALQKQDNIFNLKHPFTVKQLNFGRDELENITWDNLHSANFLEKNIQDENLSKTIKIKVIKSAAYTSNEELQQKEFAGAIVELPRNISQKSEIDFSEKLSSHLAELISTLPDSFNHATIIISGELINYTEVKSAISKKFIGNIYSPNRPELCACIGGCLPDDFNKLMSATKNNSITLAPNVIFGVYTILRKIGKGGMGEVWLAQHNIMQNKVAIKTLHPNLIKSRDSVDRFMAEIRNTAMLSHQNIVRAHDAGFLNGIYYMVSDYVDGHELTEELAKQHFLPENEVLKIGLDVATALDYAWKKYKILHRDIKPDNIMIDQDGKTMLMDM
ncbi:MAG: protein kinase domain-containing protein, partial [Lentisphaeria bacterium]